MTGRLDPVRVLVITVGLAVVGAVVAVALSSQRLPEGPLEPAYDRQACAFCRMQVGEPRFAAQVQTRTGEVLFYDDPGCLVEHLVAAPLDVHAIWFHHLRNAGWLPGDRAGFVPVTPTPMGFGFGAVDGGEVGAITLADLQRRVAARDPEVK